MKYYKLIGVISLVIFSFYLTDFVTDIAINTNSLMQVIKSKKNNYCVSSVNAIIEGNTIIPGIKGKIINEMGSYLNMKDFKAFNENYLVYDYVKPDISVEDNRDKIIISGNKNNRSISLLINNNDTIHSYLKKNDINYTKMIKYEDSIDYLDNVNIESDEKKYNDLNTLLKKNNKNNSICIVEYSNLSACKKNNYYLVKPNIILKNNNYITSLNEINNGSIILIDNNFNLENFKIVLNYIKRKDLKIVKLMEIIKE